MVSVRKGELFLLGSIFHINNVWKLGLVPVVSGGSDGPASVVRLGGSDIGSHFVST